MAYGYNFTMKLLYGRQAGIWRDGKEEYEVIVRSYLLQMYVKALSHERAISRQSRRYDAIRDERTERNSRGVVDREWVVQTSETYLRFNAYYPPADSIIFKWTLSEQCWLCIKLAAEWKLRWKLQTTMCLFGWCALKNLTSIWMLTYICLLNEASL